MSQPALRVTVAAPGDLDSVTLVPSVRRPPGPGEVEIEVVAAALNFKDVLLALGLIEVAPGPGGLGSECAGHVTALGAGVTALRLGQPVVALGRGCLARYVTVAARSVVPKPAQLGMAEAATLPVAMTTAQHALSELGRLRRGESILIHAATGGVGLAALQLARRLGAEVYATAGSEAKRALLHRLGVSGVFDSRSLEFASQLRDRTHGRGVDVVLNSLSGAFVEKGLRVLAPGGRFVELGVRDIQANTPLGLGLFRAGISLCVLSAEGEDPALEAHLPSVVERVARGELAALPHVVFPFSAVGAALGLLASARHIGKVVLTWSADVAAPREATPILAADFLRACEPAAATDPTRNVDRASEFIQPDEGVEIFERALSGGWPHLVISTQPLAPRLQPTAPEAGPPLLPPRPAADAARRRPTRRSEYVAPRSPIEAELVALWQAFLGLEQVGIHDSFFDCGGDSLSAIQLLTRARKQLGVALPPHSLVEAPTVAQLAARIAALHGDEPPRPETLVYLRRASGATPLFLFHPIGGHVFLYKDLAELLPAGLPVYGIQARPLEPQQPAELTIPALVATYLQDIRQVQPQGPYLLGGSSYGGVLAYEAARQLRLSGQEVALLAMLDAPGPGRLPALFEEDAAILGYLLCQRLPTADELTELRQLTTADLIEHFIKRSTARPSVVRAESSTEVAHLLRLWRANQKALVAYEPAPYPGSVLFFAATESDGVCAAQPQQAWQSRVGSIAVHAVPGNHTTMNHLPHVAAVAEILGAALTRALHPLVKKDEKTHV